MCQCDSVPTIFVNINENFIIKANIMDLPILFSVWHGNGLRG